MSKFTVYQIADVHLRDAQYQRRSRGQDFLNAFESILVKVVSLGGSVLIVSGDFLDSTRPSPKIVEFLKRMQAFAISHGLMIYVTSGNHDMTDPHWLTATLDLSDAGGFRVIDNKLVTLPAGLSLYGLPFVNREKFNAIKPELPPASILAFHTSVQEMMNFKSESALPLAELPHEKYQVIAIGDIHIRMKKTIGTCLVSQPGSTEMCSTAEDENKVMVALDFEDGKFVGDRDIPITSRRVLRFRITSEDQMEPALLECEASKKDEPIIVIDYSLGISNIQQRFIARIDPTKAIIRFNILFGNVPMLNMGLDLREDLTVLDFLGKFIPEGTELYTLARALINDEGNATDLVDAYIEKIKKAA